MDRVRLSDLLRFAIIAAVIGIIFLSGLFPLEEYLALVPQERLTASVIPADVAALTNTARLQNGIPTLSVNPLLTEAAQMKADDMAHGSYYAHISPDGKSPLYWLNLVGYKYLNAGENLVIDRDTSEGAVDAWLNSADHRENILRPQFTEIGIGVAAGEYDGIPTVFTVQEFGTPYPLSASSHHLPGSDAAAPARTQKTNTTQAVSTTLLATSSAPQQGSQGIASAAKKFVTPVLHALVPQLPQAIQPTQPSTTATSTNAQGSSTILYTLSPAFFAPVSKVAVHEATQTSLKTVATPSLRTKFTACIQHILASFRN